MCQCSVKSSVVTGDPFLFICSVLKDRKISHRNSPKQCPFVPVTELCCVLCAVQRDAFLCCRFAPKVHYRKVLPLWSSHEPHPLLIFLLTSFFSHLCAGRFPMGSKYGLFSFSADPDLVEWKSSLQLNSPVSYTHRN